jgi:hypothetical protein
MGKLLNEYKELPIWKQDGWSVDNIKNVFADEFTEEEFDLIEQIYYHNLEKMFPTWEVDDDDFDTIFELQNFFPSFVKKDVGSGSWVRVKTDEGYNIYWAKNAPQKRISAEALQRKIAKANRLIDQARIELKHEKATKLLDQVGILMKEYKIATWINAYIFEPKFIKIMVTRSKAEYLLPYQYELVNDISLYTTVIKDKMNQGAVKYRSYFTKADEDQIFYLRSRGIDKDTAILMCKLQQVYFVVDVPKLFANYMQPV